MTLSHKNEILPLRSNKQYNSFHRAAWCLNRPKIRSFETKSQTFKGPATEPRNTITSTRQQTVTPSIVQHGSFNLSRNIWTSQLNNGNRWTRWHLSKHFYMLYVYTYTTIYPRSAAIHGAALIRTRHNLLRKVKVTVKRRSSRLHLQEVLAIMGFQLNLINNNFERSLT